MGSQKVWLADGIHSLYKAWRDKEHRLTNSEKNIFIALYIFTCHNVYTVFPWIFLTLELFLHWLYGSNWTKSPPLNSPHTMRMCDHLGGCGSTFNCLIVPVVPRRAAKLVEIIIYDRSTVQYSWIRQIYHDQVQISCSFELNLPGAQYTYERGSVAMLIVSALV